MCVYTATVVSSRLQARATRARRARAGETEERARLHARTLLSFLFPLYETTPAGVIVADSGFVEETVGKWELVWPPSVPLSQHESVFFVY